MSRARLERIAAVMPPEGTDLVDFFGPDADEVDTGGLVSDAAKVNMVGRDVGQTTEGAEGFRQIWADWLEPWESYRIYYDDVIERGDTVITLVRMRGVTKRDGVEMEHEAAGVFRFDGDQVVEMEFNLDREDALKA